MSDFYLSPLGAEYFEESDYILQNAAERYSLSEAGAAGSGKDVLFSHLISLQDRPHYANIAYTEKTILAPMNLFTVGDITYEDILRGRITPITNHILDGADAYISDAAVSLSNAIDSQLKKDYPGLHIYAALRRHLNDIQIHINAQTFERCYVIYREQCDSLS